MITNDAPDPRLVDVPLGDVCQKYEYHRPGSLSRVIVVVPSQFCVIENPVEGVGGVELPVTETDFDPPVSRMSMSWLIWMVPFPEATHSTTSV